MGQCFVITSTPKVGKRLAHQGSHKYVSFGLNKAGNDCLYLHIMYGVLGSLGTMLENLERAAGIDPARLNLSSSWRLAGGLGQRAQGVVGACIIWEWRRTLKLIMETGHV